MASGCAKGCGIGCGVVALVVGIGVAVGVGWMHPALEEIRNAEAIGERLESEHGTVESWTPPVDRPLTVARLDAFLAARERAEAAATTVEELLAGMPPDALSDESSSTRAKVGAVLGMLRDMIGTIGGFLAARDEALLEVGMGPGEYGWTYVLVYHSWLGAPLDAGPVITKRVGPGVEPRTGERVFGDDHDRYSPRRVRRAVRRLCVPAFRRMVEEARRTADPRLPALEAELERIESRPDAVPWQGDLPPEVERALASNAERIRASWRPAVHPFEVVHLVDDERWAGD